MQNDLRGRENLWVKVLEEKRRESAHRKFVIKVAMVLLSLGSFILGLLVGQF